MLAGCSTRAASRVVLLLAGSTAAYAVAELAWLAVGASGSTGTPALGAVPTPSVSRIESTLPDIAAAWNLAADPVTVSYVTNAHGYRNDPDRTSADLYCVGDSFLVAALVPWPETVVARLRHVLGIPTMNVALIDQSPQTAQARFRDLDPMPDLAGKVVLQFLCEDNDLVDSASDVAEARTPSKGASIWKRSLLHRLLIRAQEATQPVPVEASRRTGDLHGLSVRFLQVHERGSEVEDQLPIITTALSDFAEWLSRHGASLGVVLVPAKTRVLGPLCRFPPDSDLTDLDACLSPMPGHLAAWSQQSGIPFLDLTTALSDAASSGRMVWFVDDTHWNSEGHEVAATAIADWPWLKSEFDR
jgi:hypothetical protein